MLERSILAAVPSEDPTAIINAVRSLWKDVSFSNTQPSYCIWLIFATNQWWWCYSISSKQQIFSHEVLGMIQKSQGFGRNLQTTHACRGVVSSDNDALPNHSRRAVQGDPIEFRDEKSYLADCVSRQLLRDHVRLNACLDNKLHAPNPDCINGL
ncbi:hypothetical protein JHK87_013482 [Glycine soja]|nr:hypothetical protein JHK87_013482 [Glycine soja]